MSDPRHIRIQDYDYELPLRQIAQYPLEQRDSSSLLLYNCGKTESHPFLALPYLLPPESFLVFNDTRVIRARFLFYKTSGAKIEIFCLEPVHPTADLQLAFSATTESYWKCYIGNARKWKNGRLELSVNTKAGETLVWAEKINMENDTAIVRFTWSNNELSFSEIMEACGHIPLPPYIDRSDNEDDIVRYQTIFARIQGSVAAPTAGLHFTEKTFALLKQKNILTHWLTLHVGAGTFKPVSSETIGRHNMHFENYIVTRELILKLLLHENKPVIPVGTTSMRTLESIYWLGVRILNNELHNDLITNQWEPYDKNHDNVSLNAALQALLSHFDNHGLSSLNASTGLIIAPGYKFRVCSGLITNFHLPKSTLLLLVAALIGDDWRKAYDFALENDFRFLSYGDCCLFIPCTQ